MFISHRRFWVLELVHCSRWLISTPCDSLGGRECNEWKMDSIREPLNCLVWWKVFRFVDDRMAKAVWVMLEKFSQTQCTWAKVSLRPSTVNSIQASDFIGIAFQERHRGLSIMALDVVFALIHRSMCPPHWNNNTNQIYTVHFGTISKIRTFPSPTLNP